MEPGGIAFSPLVGHDGVLMFGRVGAGGATTVEVTLPSDAATLTAPLAEDGFFLAAMSASESQAAGLIVDDVFDLDRLGSISAVALDQAGTVVAQSDSPVLDPFYSVDGPTPPAPPAP